MLTQLRERRKPKQKTIERIEPPELQDFDEALPVGSGYANALRRGVGAPNGRVLILPPFGLPAQFLGLIADKLRREGYESILLDTRDSNGTGSGEIENFLLSTVVADCKAAIDHYEPTVVVAMSLGARAAARAIAQSEHSPRSIFLLPVVEFQATLEKVVGRDLFVERFDQMPYTTNVLGFDIRSEPFMSDCVDQQIICPESMCRDLEAHGGEVTLMPGTNDPWIDHSTVTEVFHQVGSHTPKLRMQSLPCDQHELHKNPRMALRMIGECVREVLVGAEVASQKL